MKRLFDILLVTLILAAAGAGAYEIGRRVDHYSNEQAAKDVDLSKPITTTSKNQGPSTHTIYWVAGGVGIGFAAILLVSTVGSVRQSRRRQRWRAT